MKNFVQRDFLAFIYFFKCSLNLSVLDKLLLWIRPNPARQVSGLAAGHRDGEPELLPALWWSQVSAGGKSVGEGGWQGCKL